jgi:predicted helicase
MPRIDPELQRLKEVRTFPSLIKYLKEELNWPIPAGEADDVAFDYDPAELGFNTDATARIEEVKQLRPLETNQKWGIFWVKFGKKQLPVQMLRRALGNLVMKKRASSKKNVESGAWKMHDLLFISAYGDDDNRHITFAHFSESADSEKSLPVLKVLGWDDDDTLLHLKDTYKTLVTSLNWENTPVDDPEAWREHWSKAFKLTHKEVINTTKELVVELAQLASVIKKSVLTSIKAETEKGPWKKLMLAFQKTLIKDLDEDQFADVIAQTVSYGLLTARLSSDGQISLKNLVDMVPSTNPFLKELLQHFLTSAGMKGLFDVDEAGINDVVELLNRANAQAIRNDFGKKTDGEDPVIHFYEHFLGAYNKKLKVERGVFYTPKPIVSYIVRSVHELLQKEFGLVDGLADTSTWAEVKERHKGLNVPEGIKADIEPFVQILDPATGTATFLIEVIEVIHNTLVAKWDKERLSKADQVKKWNTYVPTHLLPRLYAYELMMAPYAIAHMKVGLKLTETGFTAWEKLGAENRANIYLTNALEPWAKQIELPGFDALAHEAASVNEVKRNKRFTIVIGNPPYSGISSNMSEASQRIVDAYRYVDGAALNEKKVWLQDDYVKFFRKAQTEIETTGTGVFSFITNHGYLDNPTFRGMRQSLIGTYQKISVVDLHGNSNKKEASPDGSEDKNVFDIRQGVAICLAIRGNIQKTIQHSNVWGSRHEKYAWMSRHHVGTTAFIELSPDSPYYFLEPQNKDCRSEYEKGWKINEAMPVNSAGFITARDHFVVDFDKDALLSRIADFANPKLSDSEIRTKYFEGCGSSKYPDGDTRGWKVPSARKKVQSDKKLSERVRSCLYRPFDERQIYWTEWMIDWPRPELTRQLEIADNIALITTRITQDTFSAFISQLPPAHKSVSAYDVNYVFPLMVVNDNEDQGSLVFDAEPRPNFSDGFLKDLSMTLGLQQLSGGLPRSLTASDIFNYLYSVLNSPGYKSRYSEFLKIDFPRLPLTMNLVLFRELARIGGELAKVHLLKSPILKQTDCIFIGSKNIEVVKATWSNGTVWIDKTQLSGFKGVSEEVWNFRVGGYQVCEKWLKDRKGRKLTEDDIEHYQKIVVALSETIRLMAEIDKVIDEHGGWPGAFPSAK